MHDGLVWDGVAQSCFGVPTIVHCHDIAMLVEQRTSGMPPVCPGVVRDCPQRLIAQRIAVRSSNLARRNRKGLVMRWFTGWRCVARLSDTYDSRSGAWS